MRYTTLAITLFAVGICRCQPTQWRKIPSPCGTILNVCLVASNGHIFAGGINSDGGDAFRSRDNGETWERVTPKIRTFGIQSFAETKDGDILMGAGGTAVLRSRDDGETWQEINQRFLFTTPRAFAITSRGHILVGAQWGIFQSTDDGKTWHRITPEQPVAEFTALQINSKGTILAGTSGSGMFRSTDNGATWLESNNGLEHKLIYSIAIDQRDIAFITTEAGGIYSSADNGSSWIPVGIGSIQPWISSVVIDSHGAIYVTSYDKGIFRSLDHGATWNSINAGMTSLRVRTIAITQTGHLLALTQGAGMFRSNPDHIDWEQSNAGLPEEHILSLATASGGSLFAGMVGQVFHSTDIGKKWTGFCGDAPGFLIYTLAINSKGKLFAGTHGEGMFVASTNSNVWDRVNARMKIPVVKAIAANLNGIMVASTWGGDLYRSTDDGTTWTQTSFNMGFDAFASFAVDAQGTLYATANSPAAPGGIFRSTDNGVSWNHAARINAYIGPIAFDSKGHLFAGTNKGVFVSENDGLEWIPYGSGDFGSAITSLAIDSSSYLYAATPRNGLFRSLQPTTESVSEPTQAPDEFALAQNYPNPFNPTTTIEFSTPKQSLTTLIVYDIIGREVIQLVAEDLSPGKHVARWTPQNIATGTYFYRLQCGAYTETKKLLYLK